MENLDLRGRPKTTICAACGRTISLANDWKITPSGEKLHRACSMEDAQ
jgi:hypothetical protein